MQVLRNPAFMPLRATIRHLTASLSSLMILALCWGMMPAAQAQFPTTPGDDLMVNSTARVRVRFGPALGGGAISLTLSGPACVSRSMGHPQTSDPSGVLGAGGCPGSPFPGTSDTQIAPFPPGFNEGTAYDEVHTVMADLALVSGNWRVLVGASATGVCPLSASYGEVEAKYGLGFSGGADAFFNLYAEVTVPASVFGTPMNLYNPEPMTVLVKDIYAFPPIGDEYMHEMDIMSRVELWDCTTGCFVGWIEQAVHGVNDPDDPDPPMPSLWSPRYQFPVLFSVDVDAEGLIVPNTCVPQPNDVYALGLAGLANPLPSQGYLTEGELFQSSGRWLGSGPDITNIDRISAALGIGTTPGLAGCAAAPPPPPPYMGPFSPNTIPAAGDPCPVPPTGPSPLGLLPGDNIISLSFGMDGGNVLLFSVDPVAIGVPGSAVNFHSLLSPPALSIATPGTGPANGGGDPGNEAAGDLYNSQLILSPPSLPFLWFGAYVRLVGLAPAPPGSNTLAYDELGLGLQAPANTYTVLGAPEDDLDAVEVDDADRIDSDLDGIIDPGRYVYFTLGPGSPSLGGVFTTGDILVATNGPPFGTWLYAGGLADIGLIAGDVVDALALSDLSFGGPPPDGVLAFGDEALFSLRVGSPSLAGAVANPSMPPGGPFSPGDVFYTAFGGPGPPATIVLYAASGAMGLTFDDELNALDIGFYHDCEFLDGCMGRTELPDTDGDGVLDSADNCLGIYNPAVSVPNAEHRTQQPDANGNGIGDACDGADAVPDEDDEDSAVGPGLFLNPIPNPPLNNMTRLEFVLPVQVDIELAVFDEQGRRVHLVAEGSYERGHHTAVWDGRDTSGTRVPAGVYWVRLKANEEVQSRKLVIMQ